MKVSNRLSLKDFFRRSDACLSALGRLERFSEKITRPLGGWPTCDDLSSQISPVLIIGCGRSGNTLLRSMLAAGGEIAFPPESYVWPRVIRKYALARLASWQNLCDLVIGEFERYPEFYTWECGLGTARKRAGELDHNTRSLAALINLIYQAYAEQHSKEGLRWGDKTPINTFYLNLIDRVFPAAQYVHIIRDPRAVACSFVEAAKSANGINVHSYRSAAFLWRKAVTRARSFGQRIGEQRYTELRYEDLVCNPEDELRRICSFLRLPYVSSMLEFYKQFGRMGDVKHYEHHTNVGKPLDASLVDKWKARITKDEKEAIERIVQPLASELGYSCE